MAVLATFVCCSDDEGGGNPTPAPATLEIGDLTQGGIIFYLDDTGEHGLVLALEDQSTSAVWCDDADTIEGADGSEIGEGAQNTLDILAACPGNNAASICSNLSSGGFDDWFLPSWLELVRVNENLALVNAGLTSNDGTALAEETYWTSTESDLGSGSSAFTYNFGFGTQGTLTKFGTARVRAARAF